MKRSVPPVLGKEKMLSARHFAERNSRGNSCEKGFSLESTEVGLEFDFTRGRTLNESRNDESNGHTDGSSDSTRTSSSSTRDENNNLENWNRVGNNSKTEDNHPENLRPDFALPDIAKLRINSDFGVETLELGRLTLDSDCESVGTLQKVSAEKSPKDNEQLIGVVISVARVTGLIVVKPPIPYDVLLYIGSPVFVRKFYAAGLVPAELVEIGWVTDIFGPACEPYYCIKSADNCIELTSEGTQLYYSLNHPLTGFVRLKREENKRYTVLYSPGSNSPEDLQNGRPIDRDWNADDAGRHSRYRRYRRRGNGKRGALDYRNRYRYGMQAQPKHTYFDF
ncbi:uncharacterized protein LOC105692735 [Athalia rosae]|uniref:uncharacterized protein LOC105692735 n=1 Tax=Athalia rosae TaxID=37344 RepID=UPI002033E565|nr:uncharacterized protein LOC105692735 [Athalia rosae]XP_048510707.1 uncharacterized protein LOC105692735 [Athalia rosae]